MSGAVQGAITSVFIGNFFPHYPKITIAQTAQDGAKCISRHETFFQ